MISKTLKPCPFCGGTDLYIDGGESLQDFEVCCVKVWRTNMLFRHESGSTSGVEQAS